jgi:cysteine synthase A
MIVKSVLELIGKTPLIEIEKDIYAKCEFLNPGGSIKDRVALQMIKDALNKGIITKDTPLVEPTSGNTGIGLAMVSAALKMNLTIVMPESMSLERRKLISHFGAKLELTPANLGMQGAIQRAKELEKQGFFLLNQFENPSNPKAHILTTLKEIKEDIKPDIFVAGVGTGGTIRAAFEVLTAAKIVAVEPKNSSVLMGCKPNLHKIQGIGAGFVPKIIENIKFNEIIAIEDEIAINTSKELAKTKGLLVGISSGANIAAAKKLKKTYPNKKIVTILPDTGERYLSTELFE